MKVIKIYILFAILYNTTCMHLAYSMRKEALQPEDNTPILESYAETILEQAINSRSPTRVAKVLDTTGIDINKKNAKTGHAPLHAAITKHCLNIVQTLINKKAHIDIRCNNGMTPLYYAVSLGNAKIVNLLLEHKADPEITDNKGQTPLFEAVQCTGPSAFYIFNKLIEAKASLAGKNHNGNTLLDVVRLKNIKNALLDAQVNTYLQSPQLPNSAPERQVMTDLPHPPVDTLISSSLSDTPLTTPFNDNNSTVTMCPECTSFINTKQTSTSTLYMNPLPTLMCTAENTTLTPTSLTTVSSIASVTPNDTTLFQQNDQYSQLLTPDSSHILATHPAQEEVSTHGLATELTKLDLTAEKSHAEEKKEEEGEEEDKYSADDEQYQFCTQLSSEQKEDPEIPLDQWVLIEN